MLFVLLSGVLCQRIYPEGCNGPTFPNASICLEKNWNLGEDAVDKCAPLNQYPIYGEQVYIQDANNFCFMLPDPNNNVLKDLYYSKGKLPSIAQGEGYVQSFCVGEYMPLGSMKMDSNAIKSAHVVKGVHKNGKKYYEISGTMDCALLNINCTSSAPGLYDDGGQVDAVSYRNCGKEPYSGVDKSKHPGLIEYVQQAGNGEFCMRICEKGQQLEDPCNVKNDTAGCRATFGIEFKPGFSFTDLTNSSVSSSSSTVSSTVSSSSTLSSSSVKSVETDPSTSSSVSLGFRMYLGLVFLL